MTQPTPLFTISSGEHEALYAAVERSLQAPASSLAELPTLTNVALGDPYLAEQLAVLHRTWELRPEEARGLLARLRTRLAWWLLGPELRQASHVNATLVRLVDSLVVQLDQERSGRRRIEEHLANAE